MSSSTAGDGRDTRLRVQPGGGLPRAGSAASLPTTVAPPLSTGEKARSLRVRQAAVALCYMGSAILLIVFNKAALSSYSFNFPNVITMLQLMWSCTFLGVARHKRWISFTEGGGGGGGGDDDGGRGGGGKGGGGGGKFVPLRKIVAIAPLSLAYLVYMVLGMASIGGVNLAMYTTLRRTTPAFTMTAEALLAGRRFSHQLVGSVALMVVGAVLAGANDLSFDASGYLLVLASNTSTAVYLAVISRLAKTGGLSSFGLMWCNGLVCVPCLVALTAATGELRSVLDFPHLADPGFLVTMAGSCSLAILLNYTIFLNTAVNSAVTQTVCGNLKDFVVIAVGFFAFGGVRFDPLNAAGMAVGMAGSVWYAAVKLKSK